MTKKVFKVPRMLYQFLGNKAEKGPSITTEVKVTLEQMYNGDSNGDLLTFPGEYPPVN